MIGAPGIALLLPLYLSQRRDVQRLRAWMNREPEHPAADIAASEAILDRAEAELEELAGPETGSGRGGRRNPAERHRRRCPRRRGSPASGPRSSG